METKELLEKRIAELLSALPMMTKGSVEHSRAVEDLAKLLNAWCAIIDGERQKEAEERKFREDIRSKDLDRDYRDKLERERLVEDIRIKEEEIRLREKIERDKLETEARLREEERKSKEQADAAALKQRRANDIAERMINAGGIVIPLVVYAAFLMVAMRLEFMDNGSITSFTAKELFKRMIPIRL